MYALFAWTVSSMFIAIPVLAFAAFLYLAVTSRVSTSSARSIIRRDEDERRFDALHSQGKPVQVRPSQARLLRSFLTKCEPDFHMHSEERYSFNSDGLEIFLTLAPTLDRFTALTLHATIARKIGLTSRIKSLKFEDLKPNQQVVIANERFNFGDLLLVENGYIDNLELKDFQTRVAEFRETLITYDFLKPVSSNLIQTLGATRTVPSSNKNL